MKWKRSRKAQQESKNKDKDNNDDKRERSTNSNNQSSSFKNEKVANNLTPNSFHFPKNPDLNSHLPPHAAIPHQRLVMPGSSKDLMQNSGEENSANNVLNRPHPPNVFNECDDMIWRVV